MSEKEIEKYVIDEEFSEKIAGGKCDFNKIMSATILSLAGLTGVAGNNQIYALKSVDHSPKEQVKFLKSPIKTVKSRLNNTLSNEEMKYYQEKIGSKYKLISNTGISGSFATAYKLKDYNENEFILKIPNDPEKVERWIQMQKKTDEKIKKYYKDYHGELKITNYIKIGDDFVIEEYLGETIDFNKIKDDIKYFVNSMAEFLNYTHKYKQEKIIPIEFRYLNDAYNYLNDAKVLNEEDNEMLKKLIYSFEHRDTSDEISALVHNDIRHQNLVYNPKTKKFALIDFDSLYTDSNIYWSFTSRTVGSCCIPFDLISKIIDKYNEISDTKVNKEKIKLLHKLGTMVERYVCFRYRDGGEEKDIRNKLWEGIKQRFQEIDNGFKN